MFADEDDLEGDGAYLFGALQHLVSKQLRNISRMDKPKRVKAQIKKFKRVLLRDGNAEEATLSFRREWNVDREEPVRTEAPVDVEEEEEEATPSIEESSQASEEEPVQEEVIQDVEEEEATPSIEERSQASEEEPEPEEVIQDVEEEEELNQTIKEEELIQDVEEEEGTPTIKEGSTEENPTTEEEPMKEEIIQTVQEDEETIEEVSHTSEEEPMEEEVTQDVEEEEEHIPDSEVGKETPTTEEEPMEEEGLQTVQEEEGTTSIEEGSHGSEEEPTEEEYLTSNVPPPGIQDVEEEEELTETIEKEEELTETIEKEEELNETIEKEEELNETIEKEEELIQDVKEENVTLSPEISHSSEEKPTQEKVPLDIDRESSSRSKLPAAYSREPVRYEIIEERTIGEDEELKEWMKWYYSSSKWSYKPGSSHSVHERTVMTRIAELRREGKWSLSRIPICEDPPRNKTAWDYFLEEILWLEDGFYCQRLAKLRLARIIAQEAVEFLRARNQRKQG
uniref:Bromo domain-containing protein n=1 Tax=Steinernema glaseri TaxID=37863 RepID=A0A1I8A086_9BILA